MLDPQPGSPDWWLLRLSGKLMARQRTLDAWWKLYKGEHLLPQGPAKAVQAYLDFQKKARTNFLAGVVDSSVFRLQAIGVSNAAGDADAAAWRWWQLNKMDSKQKQLFRTVLALGQAYVIVGEHPVHKGQPLFSVEHPRECITECDPATGEVLAGLKVYYDEMAQEACALLLLPEVRVEYRRSQAARRFVPSAKGWDPGKVVPHMFGRPQILAFECRPELGETPEPEFERGVPVQDRINLGVLNRMTAARYSAFRQRYVTGHRFQTKTVMTTEIDPVTGLPVEVPKKVPAGMPFVPDPSSVWVSEGENAHFGEFSQTDLQGYLKSHEADIRDLLVITHTPVYSVITQLINIGTDTISALDAMHLAKVREHQVHFGEQFEDMLSLAAVVAGQDRDFAEHEIRWEDPRNLNPAVLADAGVKKRSMGYPLDVVAEELGESPQRIRRIVTGQAGETLMGSVVQQPLQTGPAAASALRNPAPQQAAPGGDG